jgi:hypothetical protein
MLMAIATGINTKVIVEKSLLIFCIGHLTHHEFCTKYTLTKPDWVGRYDALGIF